MDDFIIKFCENIQFSQSLALFVLQGPKVFPFLTDYDKNYLMQLFVNHKYMRDYIENLRSPHPSTIIRFAMLCKATYLHGNIMARPISDGELDVIPRKGFPVHSPTRYEMISLLKDVHRLGGIQRRLSSWRDPINTKMRRIFIMACRKNHIKFVPKELLCHIIRHLWQAVQ